MLHRLTFATLSLFAVAAVVCVAGAIGGQTPAVSVRNVASPHAGAQAAPAAQPAGYAGSDTCVLCHTDTEESLKGTAHWLAGNPR